MTRERMTIAVRNHHAIDIAVTADRLWRTIVDQYAMAAKFRDLGYTIVPADDSGGRFGGYRMWLDEAGQRVDERVIAVTEQDDEARRLSLFADYLTPGDEMQVCATYQACETDTGSQFRLDCHSRLTVAVADADPAIAIAAIEAESGAYLDEYLAEIRDKLEKGA